MQSRSPWYRIVAVFVAVAVSAVFVPQPAVAAPSWRLIDLGAGDDSEAIAINDLGHVVGNRNGTSFLLRDGRFTELGSLPGGYTRVSDINNRDEVVGWSFVDGDTIHGFLWRRGTMIDLGALPGGRDSQALAINDRSEIVGNADNGSALHGFVWRDGVLTDLGGDPVNDYSDAQDINNAGQIAGYWGAGNYSAVPVRWSRGERLQLSDELGGATGINGRGHVTGSFVVEGGGFSRGYLWRDGRFTAVDPPAGASFFIVRRLNNRDQVVGRSDLGGVVWQDGRARVLPKLGEAAEANDIDEQGRIAGYSTTAGPGFTTRAVLWVRQGFSFPGGR